MAISIEDRRKRKPENKIYIVRGGIHIQIATEYVILTFGSIEVWSPDVRNVAIWKISSIKRKTRFTSSLFLNFSFFFNTSVPLAGITPYSRSRNRSKQ